LRCFDCGKTFKHKLNEVTEGRRTYYLCDMCKAEREWRESKEITPPLPEKKSFWEKLKDRFKNWRRGR